MTLMSFGVQSRVTSMVWELLELRHWVPAAFDLRLLRSISCSEMNIMAFMSFGVQFRVTSMVCELLELWHWVPAAYDLQLFRSC